MQVWRKLHYNKKLKKKLSENKNERHMTWLWNSCEWLAREKRWFDLGKCQVWVTFVAIKKLFDEALYSSPIYLLSFIKYRDISYLKGGGALCIIWNSLTYNDGSSFCLVFNKHLYNETNTLQIFPNQKVLKHVPNTSTTLEFCSNC